MPTSLPGLSPPPSSSAPVRSSLLLPRSRQAPEVGAYARSSCATPASCAWGWQRACRRCSRAAGLAVVLGLRQGRPQPRRVERRGRCPRVQGAPGRPHRLARRRLAARRGEAHRPQDHARTAAPRVRRRHRRRRPHHVERPADHHDPHHGRDRQRSRSKWRRHAEGDGAQDGHLQPVLAGEGGAPRSGAHGLHAQAHHRRHRLRRAHALPRVVLRARRSPDGRRDRARRAGALREEPGAPKSWRAASDLEAPAAT